MAIDDSSDIRISLPELADDLQCYKQSLFKIVKRLAINPVKRRDADRKNQLVATVTELEAIAIRREFLNRVKNDTADSEHLVADVGLFYVMQLEPEHDPGRIKLGFTTDLEGRLRKHRCSAPFAQSVKTWPCRRLWKRTAIDCLTPGVAQLHTEVFRVDSLEEILLRGDGFFKMMPAVLQELDVDDISGL